MRSLRFGQHKSADDADVKTNSIRWVHLHVFLEFPSQPLRDPLEGVHDATLDLGMVVADADSQALEAGELRLEALEGVERKTGAGLSIEEKPRVGPEQSVIHMPSC